MKFVNWWKSKTDRGTQAEYLNDEMIDVENHLNMCSGHQPALVPRYSMMMTMTMTMTMMMANFYRQLGLSPIMSALGEGEERKGKERKGWRGERMGNGEKGPQYFRSVYSTGKVEGRDNRKKGRSSGYNLLQRPVVQGLTFITGLLYCVWGNPVSVSVSPRSFSLTSSVVSVSSLVWVF